MEKHKKDNPIFSDFLVTYHQVSNSHQLLCKRYQPSFEHWKYYQNITLLKDYIDSQKQQIHNCLEIKTQKLIIEIRQLVCSFAIKGINVLQSICVEVIGVKIDNQSQQEQDLIKVKYRQSMGPTYGDNYSVYSIYSKYSRYSSGNRYPQQKQIPPSKMLMMPTFKIFIDSKKCSKIIGEQKIGRFVIQAERYIHKKFKQQIYDLVAGRTNNKDILKINPSNTVNNLKGQLMRKSWGGYSLNKRQEIQVIHKNIQEQLQFTKKKRKRKIKAGINFDLTKIHKKNIQDKYNQLTNLQETFSENDSQKVSFGRQKTKTDYSTNSSTIFNQNLMKINITTDKKTDTQHLIEKSRALVEKSKKGLEMLKDKLKNKT